MPARTIADVIAANESPYVNCGHPACCYSVQIDLRPSRAGSAQTTASCTTISSLRSAVPGARRKAASGDQCSSLSSQTIDERMKDLSRR